MIANNVVDVKVSDGNLIGYLTVAELSKKSGATEAAIRRRFSKGQLNALVIGHGNSRLLFFPENTFVPVVSRGRPKK